MIYFSFVSLVLNKSCIYHSIRFIVACRKKITNLFNVGILNWFECQALKIIKSTLKVSVCTSAFPSVTSLIISSSSIMYGRTFKKFWLNVRKALTLGWTSFEDIVLRSLLVNLRSVAWIWVFGLFNKSILLDVM